jgi:hypothetical protein
MTNDVERKRAEAEHERAIALKGWRRWSREMQRALDRPQRHEKPAPNADVISD